MVVISNQNLFDICVQETGSLANIFEIALANNISITDNLTPADEIILSNYDNDFVNYFKGKNQKIATGIIPDELIELIGIGSMIIENNFIVG
jgi:hypothetical protein